jgi:hypothetical protein
VTRGERGVSQDFRSFAWNVLRIFKGVLREFEEISGKFAGGRKGFRLEKVSMCGKVFFLRKVLCFMGGIFLVGGIF